MSVSNVAGGVQLNASFTEIVTAGLTNPQNLVGSINSNLQFTNGTGAGLTLDLMYSKQLTLSASVTVLDFSALPDMGGTTQNWVTGPGRVRFFGVQVVTSTAGFDCSIYADSSSGWAVLPGSASPQKACANGGVFMLFDPNSNGSGKGLVLAAGSKKVDLDPGANTVVVNVVIVGDSVL